MLKLLLILIASYLACGVVILAATSARFAWKDRNLRKPKPEFYPDVIRFFVAQPVVRRRS